jgi:DNA-binding NtrC family response regulator
MKIVNQNKTILVVDDDQSVTASMALMLKQNGYSSVVAESPIQALSILNNQHIDLVIQDMNFSRKTTGEEGMALLNEAHKAYPSLPILLMTAWGSISLAVAGIRNGAVDFITKPWNNERLLQTINTTLRLSEPVSDNVLSREELDKEFNFSEIIGNDPALLKVLTTVARVSKTDAAVMILGDSGTGKELIANAIHINSLRNKGPLVKVNLGGISTSLFESEMFGHVKGAFTDAKTDREGRFSLANNGTIFLDEIGDLDKASQVKILRVLQDQTYQIVGSSLNKHSNVRVISATNKNVEEMINEGSFREDLLYRLNLITIKLPPLRERFQDIKQLAENHLLQIEKMYGLQELSISLDALKWMEKQQWPGNIRQLKQSIERAVLMSGHSVLTTADMTQQSETSSTSSNESVDAISKLTLDEVEEIMIKKTLETYKGHITKVAKSLGLSRAALYRRIEKYEIKL